MNDDWYFFQPPDLIEFEPQKRIGRTQGTVVSSDGVVLGKWTSHHGAPVRNQLGGHRTGTVTEEGFPDRTFEIITIGSRHRS